MGKEGLHLEVAVADVDEQVILNVLVQKGATIAEVIENSGILARFPDIDLQHNKVGIFGKVQSLEHEVSDRDRVEIYRPITCDPKEVRRQRAKKS
ncbi:MAG TPA: RnfH family protein [Gammaproteobacteria bacterium]|nr:RnfH family protein [Gammaproteobacteria bacterium]